MRIRARYLLFTALLALAPAGANKPNADPLATVEAEVAESVPRFVPSSAPGRHGASETFRNPAR